MHDGQSDGKALLHAHRVLGKELFVFVRQADQRQRVLHCMAAGHAAQRGEDTKVFGPGQVGVEARRFNEAADAGQQRALVARERRSPQAHAPGCRPRQPQQQFHRCGFARPVAAKQAVDAAAAHMQADIGDALVCAVLFGQVFSLDDKVIHIVFPPSPSAYHRNLAST